MKNLADLVNTLATTAGIPQDSEEFKALIQIKELATTSIPEELGKTFTESLGGLLSMDAAKNNTEVKDHFTALALNGVDTEIDKLDLSPELKTLLDGAGSTYKKIPLITEQLKVKYDALIEEAKKATGKEDPEKMKILNTQIEELNKELGTIKESTIEKSVYDTAISNHAAQLKDMSVRTLMSGRKLTTALPREVVISAGMDVFNKALSENGMILDAEMNFKTADGTMDYFDKNNQKVNINDFVDGLLADNKLLDVSPEGGNPNPPAPGNGAPTPPPAGSDFFDQHAASVEQDFSRQT